MEFLQALDEAKQKGITQEDFVKIWDAEIKLKQQQEEARLIELKLASGKVVQDSAKNVKDQVKKLLQKHTKDIQQQINELKIQLQHDNDTNFEEITKQFKSQGAATAMVIRNELESVLGHYAVYGTTAFPQQAPYSWGYNVVGDGASGNGYQVRDYEQQNFSPDHINSSSRNLSANYDEQINGECLFPSEHGAILCVSNLEELVSSSKVFESRVYLLDECRSKVQLSIWFKSKGPFNAQLAVSGDHALKVARVFTITGFVENRNSGSYSPLFEGKSQPLKKLKPEKKMLVNTSVCLQTGKGAYENATYDELEKRNFVIDDSLIIKWFVTSEVVQVE